MATATILPLARTVFSDTNGIPLEGGMVYFYIPNTTTFKTTWQDANETIPNTNPVILDDLGSALIYGSGQYRQIVKDKDGNTIWDNLTQDLISLVNQTNYIYIATSVSGSANAVVVSTTQPTNFILNVGVVLTVTPNFFNTGPATLAVEGTGAIPIKKSGEGALIDLAPGDIGGFPLIVQYNGSVWFAENILFVGYEKTVSVNQSVTVSEVFTSYVNIAPVTYTIAQSTTLVGWWYVDIYALSGAATIVINGTDSLNGGTAGSGIIMPQGTSGRIITDANGNLYLTGTGSFINSIAYPTLGQCLFTNTSVSTQTLMPKYGNRVSFPSGLIATIGSAGIPSIQGSLYLNGTINSTLSSNTFYYAYLANIAGVYTVDWSVTGHATDTTTGIEIKSGDPTRVLIGCAYVDGSGHFQNNLTQRLTLSWFNRRSLPMTNAFTANRIDPTGVSLGEINSEIRLNFLSWADESVIINGWGSVSNNATNSACNSAIAIDSTTAAIGAAVTSYSPNTGQSTPYSINITQTVTENTIHFATMLGSVSANTATWGNGAGTFSQMTGIIKG